MDSSVLLKACINEQPVQLLTYNFYLLAIKTWLNVKILYMISPKICNILLTNIIKYVQDLCTENYKTLLRETTVSLREVIFPCSWISGIHIVIFLAWLWPSSAILVISRNESLKKIFALKVESAFVVCMTPLIGQDIYMISNNFRIISVALWHCII